ncbi:hypothetical protein LCGC14_3140150 [marine sediment metagenome]|uniref:Uncharacterized protein n=1 Tax=marine sediment metagenome TaxID=412755 RepID=A0A0F8VX31_9ZZZZ
MRLLIVDKAGNVRKRLDVLGLSRNLKNGKIRVSLWGGQTKELSFSNADMLLERGIYDENRI